MGKGKRKRGGQFGGKGQEQGVGTEGAPRDLTGGLGNAQLLDMMGLSYRAKGNDLSGFSEMLGEYVVPEKLNQLTSKDEKKKKRGLFGRHKKPNRTSLNEVKRVRYKRGIGQSGERDGFFKPTDSSAGDMAGFIGISQDDPHMSSRAVSSSRLDKALGLGVLSEDVYARHGGKDGSVSSRVKGHALTSNLYEEKAGQHVTDEYMKTNPEFGQKYHRNEDGSYNKLSGTAYQWEDVKNPAFQKSMSDLSVLDYLTGQIDRHGGNMFVDPETGKVTGIDNDQSFGKTPELGDRHWKGQERSWGHSLGGKLPGQVDRKTGEAILAMTEEQLRQLLVGEKGDPERLDPEEVKAAITRFRRLQSHIGELEQNGELVDEWNDETFEKSTSETHREGYDSQNHATSYLARYVSRLRSVQGGDRVQPA